MKIHYFALLYILTVAGCHVYVPTPVASVSPDQQLRVVLNSAGRQAVETQVGPNVDYIQGAAITHDSASLTMSATVIKRLTTGVEKYETERRVIIPLTAVSSVGQVALSKRRTAVAIGASAIGAVLLGNALSGGELLGGKGNSGGSAGEK